MSDDFSVMINSLGNAALSWIPDAAKIEICADELEGTALMWVDLTSDSWQARERAEDKFLELRSIFIDDVSLDLRFGEGEGCAEAADSQRTAVFA